MSNEMEALKAALEAMPVAVSWASLEDRGILYMNRAFRQIFGYTLADLPTLGDWSRVYENGADWLRVSAEWEEQIQSLNGRERTLPDYEIDIRCKDGSVKTVLHGGVLLPKAGWALATFVDITDTTERTVERQLQEAQRRGREQDILQGILLAHSQEMLVISPRDRTRRAVSPGVVSMLGYTPEEYLARQAEEAIHPDDHAPFHAAMEAVLSSREARTIRVRMRRKDGLWRWIEKLMRPYEDPETGEVLGYVASMLDVTDRKEQEDRWAADNRRLQYLAGVDELTGLANRRAFNRALETEAARHSRHPQPISMLMVDVDYFKAYNDEYGHVAGDACLRRIADVMKSVLGRATDLLARFGGEEFVILLPGTDDRGAEKVARAILGAIRSAAIPHPANPSGIVTASIGAACCPGSRPLDTQRIVEQADKALYAAKDAGRDTLILEHCRSNL